MKMERRSVIGVLLLLALSAGAPLYAQSTQEAITGTVRDTTGAVMPGVTVSAMLKGSTTPHTAVTGPDGTFTMPLAPGTYTLTASPVGFRRITQAVEVAAGGMKPLDFTMEPQLSEEVTVTAMKRESTVLAVPFSVVAPTAETLRDRGVEDIEGIAANVGGFTVQNLGPGQSQIAMRGVSAGQIVRDQPGVKEQVGVYLDESAISLSLFTPDLDLFDTQRIEVLRGPQGTLFGSGSVSGTVRYITNQPELGVTNAVAEFGGSVVGTGAFGGNAKLAFNVPLGSRAALRVASYYTRMPGFIDAVQPDLSVRENVNDGYRTGVRAAVKFAPSDNFSITPRLVYQKVETGTGSTTTTSWRTRLQPRDRP